MHDDGCDKIPTTTKFAEVGAAESVQSIAVVSAFPWFRHLFVPIVNVWTEEAAEIFCAMNTPRWANAQTLKTARLIKVFIEIRVAVRAVIRKGENVDCICCRGWRNRARAAARYFPSATCAERQTFAASSILLDP